MNKLGIITASALMLLGSKGIKASNTAEKMLAKTNPIEVVVKESSNLKIKSLTSDEYVSMSKKLVAKNDSNVKIVGGGKDPDIKYFKSGNIKSRALFYENGQISSKEKFYRNQTNQVKEKQTYFPDGLKKSYEYYDINGKPLYVSEFYENGTLKRKYEANYNSSGEKLWEGEVILSEGDCCNNKSGWHTEKLFDRDGKIIELYTLQKYGNDSIVETKESAKISSKNIFRVNENGHGVMQSSSKILKNHDGSKKSETIEEFYKDGTAKYYKFTSWKDGQAVYQDESSWYENGILKSYKEAAFDKSVIFNYDSEGILIEHYSIDPNGKEIERWK